MSFFKKYIKITEDDWDKINDLLHNKNAEIQELKDIIEENKSYNIKKLKEDLEYKDYLLRKKEEENEELKIKMKNIIKESKNILKDLEELNCKLSISNANSKTYLEHINKLNSKCHNIPTRSINDLDITI